MHKRSTPGTRLVAGACGVLIVALSSVVGATPARAEDLQSKQWYLKTLHAAEAQKISTGKGVVVAVLDTGVLASHPDLAGRMLPGTDWPPEQSEDKGWSDSVGHGTAVAGIIAAKGGPGHLLGLAPDAKILPVEMDEMLPVATIPPAIRWAVDHGAQVINISSVATSDPPGIAEAVQYALDHDVVVVASAGNVPKDTVHEPASIPGVLAVSGLDETGKIWSGSTTGPEVVISAPATNMFVLGSVEPDGSPGPEYGRTTGGTSASAPMVAAAAAMIRAKYPKMTAPDVINQLIRTADDAGPKGRDPQYGYGKLDIVKALTADIPSVNGVNPLGNPVASPAPQASGIADRLGKLPLTLVAAAAGILLVVVAIVIVAVAAGRRRTRSS